MDLRFSTPRLQSLAESPDALELALGGPGAEDAMAAFGDLRAAPTLEHMRLLPGNCRQAGDRFAVSLVDGGGIVFEPVRERPRASARQVVSWPRVRVVEVCAITPDLVGHDSAFRLKIRGGVSS